MSATDEVLAQVVQAVADAGPGRLLVGVDGVDGVGKTTMADALAAALSARGRDVIRVSLDGFLRPRAQRYARGRDSAQGYYLDSVDTAAFLREVVAPLREPEAAIRTAVLDHLSDSAVHPAPLLVPTDGVVVVDGVFLHRRELAAVWDVSVLLVAPFELTVARMAARDGTSPDPDHPTNRRYVGGQRLYLDECRPAQLATVVVDVRDLDRPQVLPGGEA